MEGEGVARIFRPGSDNNGPTNGSSNICRPDSSCLIRYAGRSGTFLDAHLVILSCSGEKVEE